MRLPTKDPTRYRISFDGGARHRSATATLGPEGPRAVGAGAILWGPPNSRGARQTVAQVALSGPNVSNSMVAGALGLRAAMALAYMVTDFPGAIEVVGDNLPVLRMAAGNGQIRGSEAWQALETSLLHVTTQGWHCQWIAVRRIYNAAADLATNGTEHAVDCAASGMPQPSLRLWLAQPDTTQGPLPWHTGWNQGRVTDPFWTPE